MGCFCTYTFGYSTLISFFSVFFLNLYDGCVTFLGDLFLEVIEYFFIILKLINGAFFDDFEENLISLILFFILILQEVKC